MGRARLTDAGGAQRVRGSDELVLEIAPEAEQIRTARLFAAAAARHFNVDEERVEDLKVAISEACTNSFRAHQSANLADPVVVVAAPVENGVRYSVVDSGDGFDPGSHAEPEYTPPTGIFEGSLGLALIRTLFPGVEITRNAGRGMTVSFVVSASAGDA